MSQAKNGDDSMDSAKDKQVNCRRTEGAGKAERSMREAHHELMRYFRRVARKNEENLEKNILFGRVLG